MTGLFDQIKGRQAPCPQKSSRRVATTATPPSNQPIALPGKVMGVARPMATSRLQGGYREEIPGSAEPRPVRLTREDVDLYKGLGISMVHLRSQRWGDIFLMLERTGQERVEFTPEEILMLSQAVAIFDGEVVGVSKARSGNCRV